MTWLNSERRSAAVIVAHPDDETIFMGGTILTYPDWDWYIYSVTYSPAHIRGMQFEEAMEAYKRFGVNIVDYQCLKNKDSLGKMTDDEGDLWKESIGRLELRPDIVFTHNKVGEYRHEHHIALNKIVNGMFDNVWEFICPAFWRKTVVHQPFKEEAKVVPLVPPILENKTTIFNHLYTSELEAWRTIPDIMRFEFCSGFEVFTK